MNLPRAATLRPRVSRLLGLLDRRTLFTRRWQMVRADAEPEARVAAEQTLERLMNAAKASHLWQPNACFSFFAAGVEENALAVQPRHPGLDSERLHLSPALLRQVRRILDDAGCLALQLATLGNRVAAEGRRLSNAGRIADAFLLHGLAAELTEALAEHTQQVVMRRAGWTRARRVSPGYPAWSELADQTGVFRLLRPGRIGVGLSETFQMVPEYSTTALVIPG